MKPAPRPSSPRAPAPLSRAGVRLADLCERYFPDAFVFALLAVVLVFAAGLLLGERPGRLVAEFGNGFWVLVPFTMQMALVIIGGFVVASSPPVAALIRRLAALPKTPRGSVAFVAFFSMATSLLSWGLSLIFTGLLVREITRRLPRVDYRAIGAAAYLGLGSVWALGLSSSAALLQATKSSIPAALLPVTGVIPLSETIFLWQSLLTAAVLIAVSVLVAWFSCPRDEEAKSAGQAGILYEPIESSAKPGAPDGGRMDGGDRTGGGASGGRAATPADRLVDSPVLTVAVAAVLLAFLAVEVRDKGPLAAIDLNNFNLAFLAFGLLLHWRPRSFLAAVSRAVPATSGVLIQFPFYAGIFGLISKTGIAAFTADLFVRVTTQGTFPIVVAIYSAILGLFVPSGGGKWVVEAPYVMAAANSWGVHLGWTVQIYNAAEALPNLVNPFWMLPLMGILNVRARDLAGFSILQLLFHAPLVFLLSWLFAGTLPYRPPLIP